MEQIWRTGSGNTITFGTVLAQIKEHVAANGSIYIGTDSCIDKNRCVFATAICLHGANEQSGGKYFFRRVSFKRKKFSSLVHRISHEVQQSIELALLLSEDIPSAKIELHIDISPANKGNGTSKFADMLTGYARASGFDYKIKPDAWASQSVADKHSK
jgi:predicted RNase H-related nuclease YkuK (DUF458 family)